MYIVMIFGFKRRFTEINFLNHFKISSIRKVGKTFSISAVLLVQGDLISFIYPLVPIREAHYLGWAEIDQYRLHVSVEEKKREMWDIWIRKSRLIFQLR